MTQPDQGDGAAEHERAAERLTMDYPVKLEWPDRSTGEEPQPES